NRLRPPVAWTSCPPAPAHPERSTRDERRRRRGTALPRPAPRPPRDPAGRDPDPARPCPPRLRGHPPGAVRAGVVRAVVLRRARGVQRRQPGPVLRPVGHGG